jgi:hypothetical protein
MVIGQALGAAKDRINEIDAKLTIKGVVAANPVVKVALDGIVPGGDSDAATPAQREVALKRVYDANPIFERAVRTALFELLSPPIH